MLDNVVSRRWTGWLIAAVVVVAGAASWTHRRTETVTMENRFAASMDGEPRMMLWAWETPEDLRGLDVSRAGVAFLAGEIRLGDDGTVRPRRQPIALEPDTWVMAVVRVEPTARFADSEAMRMKTARAIVGVAGQQGVRGVQVDFDATATQRDFYAAVLREVRTELPREMPLSMTALVSWCGTGSWLASLPVDEAVPMFFRMGGPATTAARLPRSQRGMLASVCFGSVGVSTDEAWPAIGPRQRVYVFRNGPWTKEDCTSERGGLRWARRVGAGRSEMMNVGRHWRIWSAGALCVAVPALCCGPFFPEAIFVTPNRPDAPYGGFAAGRLGVPQPGYRVRHLAIAYDYLSGRPLSVAEQKDAVRVDTLLATNDDSQATAPGFVAWLTARKEFGPVDGASNVSSATDRSIPGAYESFSNCLDDAFATAAKTLAARQASHGRHSPNVVEWVRGQDTVLRNCGDTPASFAPGAYRPATPPPVSTPTVLNNAPQWLTRDCAYQIAAAQFYAVQYADALKSFGAVAADRNSPWSAIAEYLTARTMIRQATIGAAVVDDNFKSTPQQRDQARKDEIAGLKQAPGRAGGDAA